MREVKKRSTRISSLALRERILGDHMSTFGVMVPTDNGKMEFIKIFHGDEQDDFCAMYGCMLDVAENLRANPPSKTLSQGSSAPETGDDSNADNARKADKTNEAHEAYERGKQYLERKFEQMKRAMGLDDSQVSDMTGRSFGVFELTETPNYPNREYDENYYVFYRPALLFPCDGEAFEMARKALREVAAEWWDKRIGGYNPYRELGEHGWPADPYEDYMQLIKDL